MRANFSLNIIHERALLIGWKRMHSRVMRVPSCNTSANYKQCPHAFKLSTVHVLTLYEVFSCGLLTSNNMISLASWCNKHFFKGQQILLPLRAQEKTSQRVKTAIPYQKLGLLANFVEHCTGIGKGRGFIPLIGLNFLKIA